MGQEKLERIQDMCMMNDVFMSSVLRNKECAEEVLRVILKDPGLKVQEVETQETVSNLYGRSIRMDVKAVTSEKELCNIEVQRSNAGAVPKRARYNSSLLDANTAEAGDDYEKLPEQYVIFITENDVIKKGLPIYHIDRVIRETGDLFEDGSHIIYVNGKIQDDTDLGRLIHDFWCKDPDKMYYKKLAEENRRLKWTEEGIKEVNSMVEKLIEEGRKEGAMKYAKKTALNMLRDGEPVDKAAKILELPESTIRAWGEEDGILLPGTAAAVGV